MNQIKMTENDHTLNQLPNDWKWVKLGEVVNVLDNLRKPINSSERQRRISGKSQEELFPYFGATGQVGWIDGFLTDGKYVLVGEDGAPFLDIFKEKAYKIKGKTWVNNHAHILKELSGVTINDFILHYLNSINFRHYVNGTTRLKLTKGNLVEIPFPLPSINTQQAIVSKIEELFSEIENGIKSLFTAQQQLKTYRQSVLKWAFEGKLTNKNVKEGELPDGWRSIELGSVCSLITDGKHGDCENDENSGYYFLSAKDVRNNTLFYENARQITQAGFNETHRRTNLKPGDICLVNTGATIGRISIAPNTIGSFFCNLFSKVEWRESKMFFKDSGKMSIRVSKDMGYFRDGQISIHQMLHSFLHSFIFQEIENGTAE